jgi:tripartite-type tricarboxylate transporter receptor subunit TctC
MAAALLLPRHVLAQTYPARSVRVILPFAPGGVVDVVARLAAGKLGEQIGKQFYIESTHPGGRKSVSI